MIAKEKSLAYTHPEIASEWHPTKNYALTPEEVTYGSNKKVHWLCKNGHEWEGFIKKRTLRGLKCPYCSNRKVISGANDLNTTHPQIVSEWHPTKNTVLPTEITYKSDLKIWWLCSKCGYEWEARVRARTTHTHTGCPQCHARQSTSFPEQAILFYVRKIYPDAISRYKEIFSNGSELDIYIPSIKLGIEYDGAYWHKQDSIDIQRRESNKYEICQKNGIKLLRVVENYDDNWICNADEAISIENLKNNEKNLAKIIRLLLDKIDPCSNPLTRKKPIFHSSVDINIERDRYEILSFLGDINDISFGTLYPEQSKDWDYSKNGKITPFMVLPGSNIQFYWKCHICGNEWISSVNNRSRNGIGRRCSKCASIERGKNFSKSYINKKGSLALNNPKLALDWHPTKNGELTPNDIPQNYQNLKIRCPVLQDHTA